MARIRTVKPEFWEDEEVGALSRDARLLFIGTWNLADDEGLLRWTSTYLKATLFMYDADISDGRIDRLMAELMDSGMIFAYQGGRTHQQLAFIVNFHKHQRINRPQPGKLPPPSLQNQAVMQMYARRDEWVCHICSEPVSSDPTTWTNGKTKPSLDHLNPRFSGGDDYPSNIRLAHFACNASRGPGDPSHSVSQYVLGAVSDSVNGSLLEGKGRGLEGKGITKAAILAACERFWKAYPRKEEKQGAFKKIETLIRGGQDPDELVAGAERYAAEVSGRDRKHIKQPTTWLNNGCWTDEYESDTGVGSDAWIAAQMAR